MKDNYLTLESASEGFFKDRASKFIAYAFPASSVEECQIHLNTVKKEHFKARHHCFAYDLGHDGLIFRASDDGEPSGTAGKPILGQIRSHHLKNILVVVVRYFGGTKLGTSGLINAYREATREAFSNGNIINQILKDHYKIRFGYEFMSQVMQSLKMPDIEISNKQFEDTANISFSIPHSRSAEQLIRIRATIENKRIEEIDIEIEPVGYSIEHLGLY